MNPYLAQFLTELYFTGRKENNNEKAGELPLFNPDGTPNRANKRAARAGQMLPVELQANQSATQKEIQDLVGKQASGRLLDTHNFSANPGVTLTPENKDAFFGNISPIQQGSALTRAGTDSTKAGYEQGWMQDNETAVRDMLTAEAYKQAAVNMNTSDAQISPDTMVRTMNMSGPIPATFMSGAHTLRGSKQVPKTIGPDGKVYAWDNVAYDTDVQSKVTDERGRYADANTGQLIRANPTQAYAADYENPTISPSAPAIVAPQLTPFAEPMTYSPSGRTNTSDFASQVAAVQQGEANREKRNADINKNSKTNSSDLVAMILEALAAKQQQQVLKPSPSFFQNPSIFNR